jgi:hypothetical protein
MLIKEKERRARGLVSVTMAARIIFNLDLMEIIHKQTAGKLTDVKPIPAVHTQYLILAERPLPL